MHAEDVGLLGHLLRGSRDRDPRRAACAVEAERREIGGRLADEAARPDHEMETEGLGATSELLPDAAEPEKAQRLAEEARRLRELLLVPRSRAERRDVVGNAAVEGEHQAERELRHGNGILPWAVRDVDAASRCVRDVDRVVAGARPHDQRQVPGVHRRGGHLRSPDHEDLRARVSQRRRQRIILERRRRTRHRTPRRGDRRGHSVRTDRRRGPS